jgi:hypothetical protein
MRTFVILLLAALLAGCREQPPAAGENGIVVWDTTPDEAQAFVLMQDADTVTIERFLHENGTLAGELSSRADGEQLRYHAATTADALISRLQLEGYPPAADEPAYSAIATLHGDTIITEDRRFGMVRTEQDELPPGTLLYLNPSVALLEQLLRRARQLGGEQVELSVLALAGDRDPRLVRSVVTWANDSVFIQLDPETQFRGIVDGEDRIRGGVYPGTGIRVERM